VGVDEEVGPSVAVSDPTLKSWTEGPIIPGDIFYLSLAGKLVAESEPNAETLLNVPPEVTREIVQLGILEIPSAPGTRPTFTLEGAATMAKQSADIGDGVKAFLNPDGTSYTEESGLVTEGGTNSDLDLDGLAFDADFCPNAYSPLNVDDGRLGVEGDADSGQGSDGWGNVCQCGDGTGDAGANKGITDEDVLELQNALLDLMSPPLETPQADARCSVSKDVAFSDEKPKDCNIKDVVIVKLALDPAHNVLPNQVCKKTLLDEGEGGP
jgi:hypothetical protein